MLKHFSKQLLTSREQNGDLRSTTNCVDFPSTQHITFPANCQCSNTCCRATLNALTSHLVAWNYAMMLLSNKWILYLQVELPEMDLRVTSVLLVLLALAEATREKYYHVPKMTKSAQPVKGQGETHTLFLTWVVYVKKKWFSFENDHGH